VADGPAGGRRGRLATIERRDKLLNSQTVSVARREDYRLPTSTTDESSEHQANSCSAASPARKDAA
jgi:hypothetical protein